MISLDELYEVVKTASAPAAPAPQDTPEGQAMAAAAKMAAPPGAPPMPQPIEQPEQAQGGVDPTAEQQKHLADIAKKDKEISDLRTKTQELSLDVKRMQMTSELQKQQQAMLDKVRNEQKLLDKKQTEFTSAEATHKANLEKETARHEVMRAKADAKSLADIAHRDADSIKANAEQNAKNYIKMVEDARKTTDSYMASKEKAFAQTQEAAKKNSPYVSVSLRSNIDSALAAAKNIGKLRSRIAKDDIKFNKIASQGSAGSAGSADTNLDNDGSATNLDNGGGSAAPTTDTKAELEAEEAAANTAGFNEAIDNMAEMISNRGTTLEEANQEQQRLAGYSQRADVNSDRVKRLAAQRAKDKANNAYAERDKRVNDILSGKVKATNAELNEAQKQRGIVTMSDKSYGGWYTSKDIESDNKKMQDAGFHNASLGQWNQMNAQAEAQAQKDKSWLGHTWDAVKGMTWGLVTGIGDAAMNAQRGADAAKAFGVERGMMGAKGKNGINTKAFEEYANAHGLSQGWGKDALSIAGNTALAAVSVVPGLGAVGAAARGAKAAVMAARAASGISRATRAASALGKGVWNAGKTMIGGSNAKLLGNYGAGAARAGKYMDTARGALMAPMMPGFVDSIAGTNLSRHTAPITNALYGQGVDPYSQSQDNIGNHNEIMQYNMAQRQESNPYTAIGQGVHSASAKVVDPFTKYASVLGAYKWKDNPELDFLKAQSRNVYNSTTAGRAASFLAPFISSATGGRLKIAPDYQLPINTPEPLDVERAISDFHSQHWRSKFNPDANKYPTPMMGHTLRQFQAAQKAKGEPWTLEYNHSILGGMSSPNKANKLNKLLSMVHDLD